MMVSRVAMEAARVPECSWTAQALADAIEARFPGGADVDLVALIDAWLADAPNLPQATLSHAAFLVMALIGIKAAQPWSNPVGALTALRAVVPP
jgi:hypothetical protein